MVAVSLSSEEDYSPAPGDPAASATARCATFTFCPDGGAGTVRSDLWVPPGFQQKIPCVVIYKTHAICGEQQS